MWAGKGKTWTRKPERRLRMTQELIVDRSHATKLPFLSITADHSKWLQRRPDTHQQLQHPRITTGMLREINMMVFDLFCGKFSIIHEILLRLVGEVMGTGERLGDARGRKVRPDLHRKSKGALIW